MIAGVIVTYNRKDDLCKNLEMLKKQTQILDRIIVVDNCSTDGTYDCLKSEGYTDQPNFVYYKTESNIGGAGGFYTGTKLAHEMGADWILLMDDDGHCADEFCLERILVFAKKKRDEGIDKLFINALVFSGDMLSFKMGNMYTVDEALKSSENGILHEMANPFNGTMISKELVDAIGYPNKDFFIKGDEVDYKQRSMEAGACIATVVNARYYHPRPETVERTVLGKKVPFFVEAPWKEYYAARNFTYMYKRKKEYKAILFELIFVKLLAIMSMKCKKTSTLKMLFLGVWQGFHDELGPIVSP